MSKITNNLFDLTRTLGKAASISNDIDNLKNGNIDKVIKKQVKKDIYKNIDKLLK